MTGFLAGLIIYFEKTVLMSMKYKSSVLLLSLMSGAITSPVVNLYLTLPLLVIILIAIQGNFTLSYLAKPALYNFYGSLIYGLNGIVSPITYGFYNNEIFTPTLQTSNLTGLIEFSRDGASLAASSVDEDDDYLIIFRDYFFINDEIRPISSFLDLVGYISLLFSFIVFIYYYRRKNIAFTILAFFAGYFGIITMFGIFDLSYIKGRAGWYFIFIFILLISALLSVTVTSYLIYRVFIFLLIIINLVTLRTHPITHYRYHDEYIYFEIRDIVSAVDVSSKIIINDELPQLGVIDQRLQVRELKDILNKQEVENSTLIVLDFNKKLPDPVLSREFQFRDVANQDITVTLEKRIEEKIKQSKISEKEIIKNNFMIIYEDAHYKIYFLSKQ
jgi:hypothetical protein